MKAILQPLVSSVPFADMMYLCWSDALLNRSRHNASFLLDVFSSRPPFVRGPDARLHAFLPALRAPICSVSAALHHTRIPHSATGRHVTPDFLAISFGDATPRLRTGRNDAAKNEYHSKDKMKRQQPSS